MTAVQRFSHSLWLALTNLPLALYFASYYAPDFTRSPYYVIPVFYAAAAGLFFLYLYLPALLIELIFWPARRRIFRFTAAIIIMSLLQVILAVDAHVYVLYRFHVNLAMLDLFFNAGGQVITFSSAMIADIVLKVILIIGCAFAAAAGAEALVVRGFKAWIWTVVVLLLLAFANGAHAFAAAKAVLPITDIANRLPLYKPLTVNSFLIKHGFMTKEELAERKVSINAGGSFAYPKNDLTYTPVVAKPLNVLFILVDSLRGDMLTSEIMPYTWAYAGKNWRFDAHYSGGNATRGGIFSLFYGLPPSYWMPALSSGTPAAIVQAARHRRYRLGVFTSAPLYKPEFNQTVFAGVRGLRQDSDGKDVFARDQDAINDFKIFLKHTYGQPFFSFIFLDNVHGWAVPEDAAHPFEPYAETVNQLDLKPTTDPLPYVNLYKNAAHYADLNIRRILDLLDKNGLAENTVVIISSDHGEEFNDNGENYWGHNSNFTSAQLHIPLVIKWPGRGRGVVRTMSVSYDISATLLPQVFGVTNPISDFSIGMNLFNLRPRHWFPAGSYLENAVIEDSRIVVIDKVGRLVFKDKRYRDSADQERTPNLLEAVRQMSEYLHAKP